MGILTSCCKKRYEFPAEENTPLRDGSARRTVRNETEDPHAPLLTKQILDRDLDDFVQGLSDDDGVVADDDEVNGLLEKND